MEPVDLKLRLLAGEPWMIEGVGLLYPPTLRDVVKIGYTTYLGYVNVLSVDPKQILKDPSADLEGINGFDVLEVLGDDALTNALVEAIKFMFKVEDVFHSEMFHQFHVDGITSGKVINHDNYALIKEVVEYTACLKPVGGASTHEPANDQAKSILEKLKRSKELVAKQKAREEGTDTPSLDLNDVISAVTVKSNSTNKVNVWDYTIYQLYDEFKRLQLVDSYDTSMILLPHVGNEKLDIKHWSLPLMES